MGYKSYNLVLINKLIRAYKSFPLSYTSLYLFWIYFWEEYSKHIYYNTFLHYRKNNTKNLIYCNCCICFLYCSCGYILLNNVCMLKFSSKCIISSRSINCIKNYHLFFMHYETSNISI